MDNAAVVMLIIAVLVLSIKQTKRLIKNRNQMIDDALDTLARAKAELEEKIIAANNARADLVRAISLMNDHADPVALQKALTGYNLKYRDALSAREPFFDASEACADTINEGVDIQNERLNGAQGAGSTDLHKRERQYRELRRLTVKLIDSTDLQIKAGLLLEQAKLQLPAQ